MMNKNYFYGYIKSVPELRAFSEVAKEFGKTAVGITKQKNIYILDDKSQPKRITVEEMTQILGVDLDTAKLIVESEGNYQLPLPPVAEVQTLDEKANTIENESSLTDEEDTNDESENSTEVTTVTLLENISKQLDKIVNFLSALFLE